MAKFAFAAKSTDNAVVAAIRGISGGSIAEIKKHLADGSPFWVSEPYDDDPEGVKGKTRELVKQLKAHGVDPVIYELDESEDFEDVDKSLAKITPEILENLFEQYRETRDALKRENEEWAKRR